nr:MAG TPA: hypothetical protein [Caudoviricetes sp.]
MPWAENRMLGGGTRLVLGYGPSRHQLVAPLPEHQQHQQRVQRELQWRLEQQQRQQLLWRPPRSDGKRVRVGKAESRVSIIKGGHILSSLPRGGGDKYITPMPGVLWDGRLLCGAVWQHTATALRGRERPAALRRRPLSFYAHVNDF